LAFGYVNFTLRIGLQIDSRMLADVRKNCRGVYICDNGWF